MTQQPAQQVVVVRTESNGLGLAGFIVSLVGLLATCGALCPIGLLLSFLGLFKPPRGFAIAGVILGLIGLLWLALFGLAMLAAVVAGMAGASGPPHP